LQRLSLQYLAARLSAIDDADAAQAAALVDDAFSNFNHLDRSPDAQHALFHAVWVMCRGRWITQSFRQ
jgi:hypothetical protein